MATTTISHYATVNPYSGEVLEEFRTARRRGRDVANGSPVQVNRKLVFSVPPDAPVDGFTGLGPGR